VSPEAGTRFSRTLGSGYRVRDVDSFVEALDAGQVTASDISNAQFRLVVAGRGYSVTEVDDYLETARRRLVGLWSDDDASAGPPSLRAYIEALVFTSTRLTRGYDEAEVDDFLDRVAAGEVSADEVAAKEFTTTRLGRGYDEAEVDAAMDEIERTLRR
jgi:DivIVA domain-containing protein